MAGPAAGWLEAMGEQRGMWPNVVGADCDNPCWLGAEFRRCEIAGPGDEAHWGAGKERPAVAADPDWQTRGVERHAGDTESHTERRET